MIIVEGPQGTGKSSLTTYLRDNIGGSNLYRLSGQRDKTPNGKAKSEYMYQIQLDYLNGISTIRKRNYRTGIPNKCYTISHG